MAEVFTCATPQFADPGAAVFRLAALVLDLPDKRIKGVYREWSIGSAWGPRRFTVSVEGFGVDDDIRALNTANLQVKSLDRRATEYFQAKGKLPAGIISGTPD